MLIEPTVLRTRRDTADTVELELRVPATLDYFPDHFPGHPMLPGVVQLGWAILASQREFGITQAFRKVSVLKFQNPIQPDTRVLLRLTRKPGEQVHFAYTSATKDFSNGRLSFADAAA